MNRPDEMEKYLSYVLYFMVLRKGSDRFEGLSAIQQESFERSYSETVREGIRASLDWAAGNPDYDYRSLVKGLAASNEEIHDYLLRFRASLTGRAVPVQAEPVVSTLQETRAWGMTIAATVAGAVLLVSALVYGVHRWLTQMT